MAPGTVRVDLFSGRDNPVWSLSDDELATVRAALVGLVEIPPVSAPDHLGYRGFQVDLTVSEREPVSRIWVYDGAIIWQRGEMVTYYRDEERRVEQGLVELSSLYLDADIFAMISDQLN